ncbi:flagella synthesis protein FlgN [Aeromonas sp. BIGb0405]|jgi:flagellar biosynthesis protein FlgN|uniref:flagella synthesis protein FlgN n=1 Tax=Aeromonas TaxID=642 RepID=UPI001CCFEE74|nr:MULTISPECIES: flagellar protein FlgN [Aeromonas]MCS3455444.1 flagella synthesis protein FlgN [Aeromonas sp. BIGb0405]UBO72834.1 flagellar protein FlgN [Aeromonas rivuli]
MMSLAALLQQQHDQLTQMQGLLSEEFELLKQRRALELPTLAERKQQLLGAIEALDTSLAQQPDLQDRLAHQPDIMARIADALVACQQQNDTNGRLLELSIVSNRRLAGFLNQLRDRNSLTYDAKGNTRSGTRSPGIKA